MAEYTYTKTPVCLVALHAEIEAATFTAKFDWVDNFPDLASDQVTVHTSSDLTAGEITELDGIISAHDGATCPDLEDTEISDEQHGNRGGGALHADATASTDGFATATQITKLDGIETAATADQTAAEIKTAYESNADTNALTDNYVEHIKHEANTGYVSGGAVARVSGLDISVASGEGMINAASNPIEVIWNTVSSLTLPANKCVYIICNSSGVISSQEAHPNHDAEVEIAVACTNATNVILLSSHVIDITQARWQDHKYKIEVIGPLNVSGNVATIASAPSLNIAVTDGQFYIGDNRYTVTGDDPITFTYWYRNGSGGHTHVTSQTAVDTDYYDTGTGTLVAMPSGKYKKDTLYVVDGPGGVAEYHLVYAQEVFDSQGEAESGTHPVAADVLQSYSLRVAGAVSLEGATQLASVIDERPVLGQMSSGSTTSTYHGDLTGLDQDHHTQYLNTTRGDARYYTETEHINTSAGAGDAGKPVKTNASGDLDATFLPPEAIVDADFSGSEGYMRKTGSGTYLVHKSNLNASTDPGVGNDSNDGYSVGSIWINTTLDRSCICLDATVGAAVWKCFAGAGATATSHQIASSTDTTTTSTSYVLMTGFAWTPPSGTWRITFTGSVSHDTKGKDTTIALYKNGSQINGYETATTAGESDDKGSIAIDRIVSVSGSEEIQIYWKAGASSPSQESTAYDRSLIFVRMGD